MKLNYLTEAELEMNREEVNKRIAQYLHPTANPNIEHHICQLLDDIRMHETYLIREKWRAIQLQKLDEMQQSFKDMDLLYSELKKIPWYHFSERKLIKQKIEAQRIKPGGF